MLNPEKEIKKAENKTLGVLNHCLKLGLLK